MKPIRAIKDFILNEKAYISGDEIDVKDFEIIKKLNEQGFIQPLNFKELVLIERELKKHEEEVK